MLVLLAGVLVAAPPAPPARAQVPPPASSTVETSVTFFGPEAEIRIRETRRDASTGVVLSRVTRPDPCAWGALDPAGVPLAPPTGAVPGVDGRWLVRVCAVGGAFGFGTFWVWFADPEPDVLSVEEVLATLDLRLDEVAVSPADRQLTGLPTWMWVPPEAWTVRTASTELGGLRADAEAVPVETRWSVDGTEVVRCAGPGVPYRRGTAPAAACTHTFLERAATVELALEVRWDVVVRFSDGRTVAVPSYPGPPAIRVLAVAEAQAVVG